jgi:prevent-host-death family protein
MEEKTVGIRELKAHLSQYMAKVKNGTVIEVTEHGRIVGRIVPAGEDLSERLAAMQSAGMIRWSGRKPKSVKPAKALEGGRSIASIIVDER